MKRSMVAIGVCAAMAMMVSNASADRCQNARVVVHNDSADTIRVQRIRYADGCDSRWRTEYVANQDIEPGASAEFVENLQYVGDCTVPAFRIFRASPRILSLRGTGPAFGPGEWSDILIPDEGGTQVCNTGVTYTVHEAP